MNKNLIILMVFISNIIFAQSPSWTNYNNRKKLYPDNLYFTGFSSSKPLKQETTDQLLNRLKESAKDELVQSVEVTVQSVSTLNTLEEDNKVKEEYKQAITSFSKVDLTGLHTETYFDKNNKTGFAIAYVKKDDLVSYYQNQVKLITDKITQKINTAEKYMNSSDEKSALKTYYECMPLFREAEEALTVLILMKLPEAEMEELNQYEQKVKTAIPTLYGSQQLDLNEVCNFITQGLYSQTGKLDKSIQMGSFTYEDTKMGSPFSRRFITVLEKELLLEASYQVITQVNIQNPKGADYLLSGTYWDEGEYLRVIAILRDYITLKPIASAEGQIPKIWLTKNNVSFKPENYEDALVNMMAFKKDEITNCGLKLEVWTNKGDDSPIFNEGDTLRFYVRVNNECYLRIIDHFADGSRVLLVDNMFIGSDKVNKVVKIGSDFLCASPFGIETLQVNGQSQEFPPLKTINQEGYDFISDELTAILKNTRGFKPIKNEDLKAEKRIIVTTMKE